MDLLHALRKLRQSIAPRHHHDVEEEFRFHIEAYQQDLIRHGLRALYLSEFNAEGYRVIPGCPM